MRTEYSTDHIEMVEIYGETNNFTDGYGYQEQSDYLKNQIEIFNKEYNQDYTNENMFGVYVDDYEGQGSLLSGDFLLVAKDIICEPRLGELSYAVTEIVNEDGTAEVVGTVVKVIRNQYTAEYITENRNTNKGVK